MRLSFSLIIMAAMMRSAAGAFDCNKCNPNHEDYDASLSGTPPDTQNFKTWVNTYKASSAGKQDFRCWDVSEITDFEFLFDQYTGFVEGDASDLSCWDTSKVTNMGYMFRLSNFNGDISDWNTGSVTSMLKMFRDNTSFNGDVGNWDVMGVTTFEDMFEGTSNFFQSFDNWQPKSDANTVKLFLNSKCVNPLHDFGKWPTDDTSLWCDNIAGSAADPEAIQNAISEAQTAANLASEKASLASNYAQLAINVSGPTAAENAAQGAEAAADQAESALSDAQAAAETAQDDPAATAAVNAAQASATQARTDANTARQAADAAKVRFDTQTAAAAEPGRFEILHPTSSAIATVPTADLDSIEGVINFRKGSSVVPGDLSLELYGMIGKSAAGDVLVCEDGEKLTSNTGFKDQPTFDNSKVTFTLDLKQATTVTSDGSQILFCASIVSSVTRLETLFTINYTFESDVFNFSLDVADPTGASSFATIDKDQTIPIDAFLCDADKARLVATNPVRVGQDIRVCAQVAASVSTSFTYEITGFKDVKCYGMDGATRTASFFDIVFDNAMNVVEGSNTDGVNSFIFALTDAYIQSAGYTDTQKDRDLECEGTTEITATNDRTSRQLRVSFNNALDRALQEVTTEESEFDMIIGIADSDGSAASVPQLATAVMSLACAVAFLGL